MALACPGGSSIGKTDYEDLRELQRTKRLTRDRKEDVTKRKSKLLLTRFLCWFRLFDRKETLSEVEGLICIFTNRLKSA
jgi:hypothetical protein